MRFLLRFQLALLLVVSAGLALLLGLHGYASLAAAVQRPRFGPYFGLRPDMVPVALTPGRYQALCLGLAAAAGLAGALLLWIGPSPARTRKVPGWWGRSARRWLGVLWQPVHQLPKAKQALAAGLLVVVGTARLYYAAYYPLSLDEVASYDFSVLPGAAVTASYYAFPNNHILANLLAGLVHALLPGASPTLALRLLPTLAGLLALPLLYAAALRYLRFGVATLGLGLYWLSPMGVYYAVAGRGYAWALLAALAGLGATAELLRPGLRRAGRQGAWVVFGLSGVLGLYAVPTHAYAMLGLGLGLLLGFSQAPARVRRIQLGHLVVTTLGVGAAAIVLYAPVGAVTGWPALLANRYVARHAWPEFRQGIGPFLLGTATELLGQRGLSAVAYCLVLGLAPLALRSRRLPAATRRLGWLLLIQLVLWLPLALLQQVYPPARTLLLVLLVFFVLSGFLAQAVWRRGPWASWAMARGLVPLGLLLVLGGYGAYRLHREQAIIRQQTQQQQQLRQAYNWLQSQPLRRIWVEPRPYALFWQHYALSAQQRPLPLLVVDDVPGARPGPTGEVEVIRPGAYLDPASPPARYHSEQVLIVPVGPTTVLLPD